MITSELEIEDTQGTLGIQVESLVNWIDIIIRGVLYNVRVSKW